MRNRGRRRRGETSHERIRAVSDAEARNGKQSPMLWLVMMARFPLETNLNYRRSNCLSCQKRAADIDFSKFLQG